MTTSKTPGSLRDFDEVATHPGPLGCARMGLAYRAWDTQGSLATRYHRPVRVADGPKKGKVVRIEHPTSKPKPPGLGKFTEAQLQEWYKFYPKAKLKYVDLVNGKRTQDKEYTPEELYKRGYFYAITRGTGDKGTEVWLKDEGDGKVIGIERELP